MVVSWFGTRNWCWEVLQWLGFDRAGADEAGSSGDGARCPLTAHPRASDTIAVVSSAEPPAKPREGPVSKSQGASIPTIDVATYFSDAQSKRAITAQIDETCRSAGFPIIVGHGVPQDLISETRRELV